MFIKTVIRDEMANHRVKEVIYFLYICIANMRVYIDAHQCTPIQNIKNYCKSIRKGQIPQYTSINGQRT